MVDLRAFALTTVAVVALSSAATAADLLPPPPAPEPPIVSADLGGWYLRGDVGVAFNNNPTFSTGNNAAGLVGATDVTFNPTMSQSELFDVGVGYQFNHWFRADVTGELRGGATFQGLEVCSNCNNAGLNTQLSDFYRANLSSYIGLLNGYVDLGTWYGLTPYVGAGGGFAYNRLSGATDQGFNYINTATTQAGYPTGGFFSNAGTSNFAWALMAGVGYDVTQNLKLELGYRYLNYGGFSSGSSHCLSGVAAPTFNCQNFNITGRQLASNDFRIGLRWTFDNAPPPAPEAPLVRKY